MVEIIHWICISCVDLRLQQNTIADVGKPMERK